MIGKVTYNIEDWLHTKFSFPELRNEKPVQRSYSFSHFTTVTFVSDVKTIKNSQSANDGWKDRTNEGRGLFKRLKRHLEKWRGVPQDKSRRINETFVTNREFEERLEEIRSTPSPVFNHPPGYEDVLEVADSDSDSEIYPTNFCQPVTRHIRYCWSLYPSCMICIHVQQLSKYGWYWGPITLEEATNHLEGLPDGSFLVRDSSSDHYLFTLSFRTLGKTCHTRIRCHGGVVSLYTKPHQVFMNIPELIVYSMISSQASILFVATSTPPFFHCYPLQLLTPVSRFTQVRSLQFLCRSLIRNLVRYDHLNHLPLPQKIIDFVKESAF